MRLEKIKLDGVPDGAQVAVAMSGGVDSSVVAALVAHSGYNVVGITMQLYDHGQAVNKPGSCCASLDIYDAKRVAEKIGFAHYVLDYESSFKEKVIDDFVESYMRGETPLPCVRCNQEIKFDALLKMTQDLGCKTLITGHYVRRIVNNNRIEMHKAIDEQRDQSYFLFGTTKDQLKFLHFPLGIFEKSKVREFAEQFELKVANKPDSQDICFVPNGKYVDIVKKLRPDAIEMGEIVDLQNNVLGHHNGIIHFTIGQRKGIGISSPEPLYVIRIDADKKRVVVGPKQALMIKKIHVQKINWLDDYERYKDGIECHIKVRSTQKPIHAKLFALENGQAYLELLTDEYGVACGQAAVFYNDSYVIGGGWIYKI